MLHIFPTSRMVREFYLSFQDNSLLPHATSIGNFESKALLVPNLKLATEDRRVLLMQASCGFENFKKLHIPDEFLAFLNNSSYLFRFFEELAVEEKSCLDLKNVDVYAEFNEHLEILEELHVRYVSLLEKEGYYDKITLPFLYKLNEDYIKRYTQITLHVEGFLNNFEWKLFKKIATIIDVNISLHVNSYNQKMRDLFLDDGIEIPKHGDVIVNLSKKTFQVLQSQTQTPKIYAKNFSLRSLQVGYVYERILSFIDEGLEPEEIVVVLPDESLAPLLKAYDKANNLNFAMGFSFTNTKIYQKLSAINEAIKEDSPLTRNSLGRYEIEDEIVDFKNLWANEIEYEDFEKLLDSLGLEFTNQTKGVFKNELFYLEVILKQIKLKLSQIFKLFLQRLSRVSLDDSRGGRVVVMGVLETRGVKYKGVIIPDFNDEFIPRFSQKDMFLSSNLREHAKLPSLKDRENLQRYFYHQIIQNAQKVAICYTENETSMVSRFLQSLHVEKDDKYDENSYATLLFNPKKMDDIFTCKDLILPNEILEKPLSASRLKEFLTCKRGYYFKYIKQIKDEDLPSDELGSNDIGNFLHKSLEELYRSGKKFSDVKSLHVELSNLLYQKHHKKALWLLEREVWQRKLLAFCKNEIERFKDGWSPYEFEVKLVFDFNGVQLQGYIDRIDKNANGEFCVLDYKSGKVKVGSEKDIETMSDFQLQFYYILAQKKYKNVSKAGYYDLNNGVVVWEHLMDEKIERLGELLENIKSLKEINFTLEEKDCPYSPYSILLGRDDG